MPLPLLNISFVVAYAHNRVIGRNGKMPWHLSTDLKRFKRITTGKPVVMGRRTFESLVRPLPERRNIVMSRDHAFIAPECEVVHGLEELYGLVGKRECMVIGGAEIYRLCLPLCRRIHLTLVQAEPEGNVFFPDLDEDEWQQDMSEKHPGDERDDYGMEFWDWKRREPMRRLKGYVDEN